MPEQTNPFKRLHDNLSVVIEHARTQGTPTNATAQQVWLDALELDEHGFYKKQFNLLLVVNECEQLIRRTQEINQERYLARIEKAKTSILCIGSSPWGRFRSILNDDFMDVLYATSDAVSLLVGEEVIPEEDLASLQADVENIINRVVDSDLEDDLKRVLFDGLESVRNALLNYQMFGAERIRNAVDRNVSSFSRHRQDFDRASETTNGSIICAYKKFINQVNATISTALKFKQLAEPTVQQVLPMLGAG